MKQTKTKSAITEIEKTMKRLLAAISIKISQTKFAICIGPRRRVAGVPELLDSRNKNFHHASEHRISKFGVQSSQERRARRTRNVYLRLLSNGNCPRSMLGIVSEQRAYNCVSVPRREFEMQNGDARWMRARSTAWDFLRSWERYGRSWILYGSLGIFQLPLWESFASVLKSYRSRTLIKDCRFGCDFSILTARPSFGFTAFSSEKSRSAIGSSGIFVLYMATWFRLEFYVIFFCGRKCLFRFAGKKPVP